MLALVLLAAGAVPLAAAPARAQPEAPVPVSLPEQSGLRAGDTLLVPIQVGTEIGVQSNVRSFEAIVTFDPEVVAFTGEAVTEGTLSAVFSGVGAEVPSAGEVRVAGFRGTGAVLTGGPAPLVLLEAVVQGEGTSSLSFVEFLFNDGQPEAELTDGSITASAAEEQATVTLGDNTLGDGQTVTVAQLFVPAGGYVAIHDASLLGPDGVPATEDDQPVASVIGVSDYLEAGSYTELDVRLFDVPGASFPADTVLAGAPVLFAMPHRETSGNETYNFVASGGTEDPPFLDASGSPVISSTVLPVEFAGAPAASVQGRDVILRWRTLSETGSAGFFVQYRCQERAGGPAEGTPWTEAAQRVDSKGGGTVAQESRYEHRIEGLAPGRYAFRVRQVDLDGGESYSAEARAEVGLAEGLVLEAPRQNPFRSRTTLRYSAPEGTDVEAVLYNSLGQQVRRLEARGGQVTVGAESLSSGLYFVRLTGAGGRVATQSIALVR